MGEDSGSGWGRSQIARPKAARPNTAQPKAARRKADTFVRRNRRTHIGEGEGQGWGRMQNREINMQFEERVKEVSRGNCAAPRCACPSLPESSSYPTQHLLPPGSAPGLSTLKGLRL